MERGNEVAKNTVKVEGVAVPTSVRRSSVPEPESTRGPVGDKTQFRGHIEDKMSDKKEEVEDKKEEVEESTFSREDEPIIRGTIVVTLYKDHPYDVEFSGDIKGNERDIAIRYIQKQYMVWKAALAKKQEKELKLKEDKKKLEEENA